MIITFRKTTCLILILALCMGASATSVVSVSPGFPWIKGDVGQLGKIDFAADKLSYFLGPDYQICDHFSITLPCAYGIVTVEMDHPNYDYDFLAVVFNDRDRCCLTPIIIDNVMLLDFTNLAPAEYEVYIVNNFPGSSEGT